MAIITALLLVVNMFNIPQGNVVKAAGASVSVTESGSWNSGTDTYNMFNCTITNDTASSISNWKVTVPMGTSAKVDQGWCGSFSLSNGTLTITPDTNNGTIAAGSSTSLGFIVKNAGSYDLSKAVLTYDGSSNVQTPSPSTQASAKPSTNPSVIPSIAVSASPSVKPSASPVSTTNVPASPATTSVTTESGTANSASTSFTSSNIGTLDLTTVPTVNYKKKDLDSSYSDAETIQFTSSAVSYTGSKATVSGSVITITAGGSYVISGTCSDGQIIVNTEEFVQLVLNGVNLTSKTSAPVYVQNADKVVITLAAGSNNTLSDTTSFTYTDATEEEPNAVIFSKDDLSFNGTGSLTVNSNFNNAIQSKDKLKFVDGTYVINSVNDGIKGKDCVGITGGTFTIKTTGDGIQSTNDTDATVGFVEITGGNITINATKDGIQAESFVDIQGGILNITTNGGYTNGRTHTDNMGGGGWFPGSSSTTTTTATESAKGLKATTAVIIAGGTTTLNTSDDAVHSNNVVYIDGGSTTIASGDDGLHGDSYVVCDSGSIKMTASYEGVEASNITFNGGKLIVDASGDGLDCNGAMTMTGGIALVSGPTNGGNGALDYDQSFTVTGGLLVAAGSSGMAMNISSTSTQPGWLVTYSSTQAAKSVLVVRDSSGKDIVAFNPCKTYQTVCVSAPSMSVGSTYSLYTGTTNVSEMRQLSSSEYTLGSLVQSATLSSIVTGNSNGMGGGFPGGGTRPSMRP